jgi:hypothetical protein
MFWITGAEPPEGQWSVTPALARATCGPDALRCGGAGDDLRAV